MKIIVKSFGINNFTQTFQVMKMNQPFRKMILMTIITTSFLGCNNSSSETSISTDKTELGEYINIEKYNPQSVKWVYNELVSESASGTLISGSFNLQAELHFKKETIDQLMDDYSYLSVTYKFIKKDELGFTWLDKDSKEKLQAKVDNFKRINMDFNDYEIDCYDTYFFKKGNLKGGGFIPLDENTVLISMFMN